MAAPGAFCRAVAGLEAARREGLLTGISAVVRPEDLADGTAVRLFELGRETTQQIFDGVTASFSGRDYLYLVVGDGADGVRLVRVTD